MATGITYKNDTGLTYNDTLEYLRLYRETNDKLILEALIKMNTRLVYKVARSYNKHYTYKLDIDDLVQAGMGGLLKAIERFDITRGVTFATYAVTWIQQGISRTLHKEGFLIRVPVGVFNDLNKVVKYEREVMHNNEALDLKKLCRDLEITEEKYKDLKNVQKKQMRTASLSKPILSEDGELELQDVLDQTGCGYVQVEGLGKNIMDPDYHLMQSVSRDFISTLLKSLNDNEALILKHRYGLNGFELKTYEALASQLGITKNGVRLCEVRALEKLNRKVKKDKDLWVA